MVRRLWMMGLAGLFVMVGAAGSAAALLPDAIHVERSREVNAPAAKVSAAIARFPERLAWIPWTTQDPEARYTFAGEVGEPGSSMTFEGEKVGSATIVLVAASEQAVVTRLKYRRPMALTTTDRFELVALGPHRTRVTWINEGEAPFGPARVFALLADSVLGPDYEEGLRRLDQHLTGQTAAR